MSNSIEKTGKTTIAPDVLTSIAKLTTLSVPGVSRISSGPADIQRLFKKSGQEGVNITVEGNTVFVDLYVIIEKDMNVRDVAHAIQNKVSRAISEMVGMDVGKVNVHVEDIDYLKGN